MTPPRPEPHPMDELHHRALNEDMDRQLHAKVEATQREFDEELATRHRQRDTPALRTIESALGISRGRVEENGPMLPAPGTQVKRLDDIRHLDDVRLFELYWRGS